MLNRPFKLGIKNWHLLLLLLFSLCAVAYSIQLTYMSPVWDETVRLMGALTIYEGRIGEYLMFTRYPPLMDFVTAGYFTIFGVSVFSARLASVTFSVLTLAAVFGLASKMYGRKVGFISCVVLATMPGYIFLSRVALLDIPIVFFFIATLFLFLSWLHSGKNIIIILCGLILGLATITKYQAIVAGLVILVALPLLFYRHNFKAKITRFPLLIASASVIIAPTLWWIYSSGIFGQWVGLLQSSDTLTNVYGARFPLPIFYALETTIPFDYMHPILLPIFLFGMLGLGFLIWRRRPEDKFLLVWFLVVYVFFTFVGTKSWRYVLPLFPVVAVSAANLTVFLYGKLSGVRISTQTGVIKKWVSKLSVIILIGFLGVTLVVSVVDAHSWIVEDSEYIALPETVHYIAEKLGNNNESVMVVCGVNLVNQKGVEFYLKGYESRNNRVLLYPLEPADAYAPNFNITRMLDLCRSSEVKYLILFENRAENYYNSTLTAGAIGDVMLQSGALLYDSTFGAKPDRIFVFKFNQTAIWKQP